MSTEISRQGDGSRGKQAFCQKCRRDPGLCSGLCSLRQVLFAVYKTSEDDDPQPGRDYLKQELPDYYDRRQTILSLLDYLSKKPSATMEHWKKDAEGAHLLMGAIQEDGV